MTNINLENFINDAANSMIDYVNYSVEQKKEDDGRFDWFDWATDCIDEQYQNVFGALLYLHNYIEQTLSDAEYDRLSKKNRAAWQKARKLAAEKLI